MLTDLSLFKCLIANKCSESRMETLQIFKFLVFHFLPIVHILPQCCCIHLISTIKWYILFQRYNCREWNKYSWQLIKSLKLKAIFYFCKGEGLPPLSNPILTHYLYKSNIQNFYSMQEIRSKYSEKLGQNSEEKSQFWPILGCPVH